MEAASSSAALATVCALRVASSEDSSVSVAWLELSRAISVSAFAVLSSPSAVWPTEPMTSSAVARKEAIRVSIRSWRCRRACSSRALSSCSRARSSALSRKTLDGPVHVADLVAPVQAVDHDVIVAVCKGGHDRCDLADRTRNDEVENEGKGKSCGDGQQNRDADCRQCRPSRIAGGVGLGGGKRGDLLIDPDRQFVELSPAASSGPLSTKPFP